MTKLVQIAVALWVILVPAFCAGGVLEHVCNACGDEPCCAHEQDCVEDPCAEVFLRPAGPDLTDLAAVEAPAAPILSAAPDRRPLPAAAAEPPPDLPRLPYPPGARPLLS